MNKNKTNNKLTKEDEIKIEACSLICETIEDEIIPIVDDFYKEYDNSSPIGKIKLLSEKKRIDILDYISCFLFNSFSMKKVTIRDKNKSEKQSKTLVSEKTSENACSSKDDTSVKKAWENVGNYFQSLFNFDMNDMTSFSDDEREFYKDVMKKKSKKTGIKVTDNLGE